MKKLATILGAILITSFSCAQKSQEKAIPVALKTAFQSQFPSAKDTKWEKEGNNFEAEFDLNKIEQSTVFDAQGNLLETEIGIEISQLPQGIFSYVKTNYPGQKIKEAARLTDAKGTVTYEAEIKGHDLIFDHHSNFIKAIKLD